MQSVNNISPLVVPKREELDWVTRGNWQYQVRRVPALLFSGDIYACVDGGSIWRRAGGVGTFVDLGADAGNKRWVSMTIAPNGDIYAAVLGGSIWRRAGGTGAFVDLATDAGNRNWAGMCAAPNGDIYANVFGGSIWRRAGGTGAFVDLVTGNRNWHGMAAQIYR